MSVEASTGPPEEIQIDDEVEEIEDDEEEEEVDEDEEEVEEEDEEEEIGTVTHGRSTGRGLTLKTLLKEGVLQPGEGTMTINYLGNKFKGDLLSDGRIKSQETSKIFGTPSAWAIYCKKIVNPDKKSGCGWASVRYRGKKLDSYKNNWYRQKRLEFEREGENLDEEEMTDSDSDGPHEQEIVEFELIGNRHPNHDMNTMVELTSFQSLGRMQPFTVTMSSSAMAVIDVHAHISTSEVVGYLAGQWDVTNHNLIVSHALPVRCRLGDGEKGSQVEKSLYEEMEKLNLSLVGWYHTHPFSPPLPTLRDIDSQMEYEMKMKGSNDASYTPCIGIIVAPYVRGGGQGATTSGFWVMPPPEHKPQEYGRPMSIQFTIVQDAFIPKDALIHIRDSIRYYKDSPDSVIFSDIFQDRHTYWDKLKTAIRMCVPKDHFPPLIDYLAKLLELKNYVNEATSQSSPKPKTPTLKTPSSPEAVPVETSVSSTSAPDVVEMSSSEVLNNIENRQSNASPDSVCAIDSISEPQKMHDSPPAIQKMEVSYSQESEKSPQHGSPQNPAEQEQNEKFQPITYREQSPPPYRPPPYQAPMHPPPYQPPQDEPVYQENKQEQSPKKDYFEEDYRHKQKQREEEEEEEVVSDEPVEYTEPPPDYHQQHFTISSSTYEPLQNEPYNQDDNKPVHSNEESASESAEPEEDDDDRSARQYSDSITSDHWAERLSSSMQQQSTLPQHSLHPQSSHQLHQQTQSQDVLQQSRAQDHHTQASPQQLHQLHQQSQSLQLHSQSPSVSLHHQSKPLQLLSKTQLQQTAASQHKTSQSHQLHQRPSSPHLLQTSQNQQLHQSQSEQLHQTPTSQQLLQATQSQQLHQTPTSQHLLQTSQSQQLHSTPTSQHLHQTPQIQSLHQTSQSQQLLQTSQSQQLHQLLHQESLGGHEIIQPMDIDGQVSQSPN